MANYPLLTRVYARPFNVSVRPREGWEPGDPLMCGLWPRSVKPSLRSRVLSLVRGDDEMFAYFDDIHVVAVSGRMSSLQNSFQAALRAGVEPNAAG